MKNILFSFIICLINLTVFSQSIDSAKISGEFNNVKAVELINQQLDDGEKLDTIFYDGSEFGYNLCIKLISKSTLHIAFGCQAGPLAGDGGDWQVSIAGNTIQSVKGDTHWIS